MPRKKPFLMTRVFQSPSDPVLIHCLMDEDYPFGRSKILWEVSFDVRPIDARYPDSSSLKVILATIAVNERGGEEIVSEFLFTSRNALMLFAAPPAIPRILQFERKSAIVFSIPVRDGDPGHTTPEGKPDPYGNGNLMRGFSEVYPLLQISEHSTPEQNLLARVMREKGHVPRGNQFSYPMQRYAI